MAGTQYYWVDEKSTFGGGENPISYGDLMPKKFSEDERFESFKSEGLISTEKVATKRQLSELEKLKEEVKELKGSKSEDSKLIADNELLTEKVAELEGGGGSGITQEQLDEASTTSVQTDLDKIKELEGLVGADVKTVQDKLDLIQAALEDVKLPLKKEELEGIKVLFEG